MSSLRSLLVVALSVAATVVSAVYVPRRNVADYGAKGDGVTDDTAAIIRAITEGRGDDPNAAYPTTYSSSSLTPALVYFPPGTYMISKTLPLIYYTQLVGDADSVPTLKVVSSGAGDIRVIDSLSETWGGNLVNQNNFFHQVRNFVIDMTECASCTGIHWQVAQATQLSNLHFKMKTGSKNQGIWMENGSGGFVSDLVFEGGIYGMWVGNQQFTSRNITIRDASEAAIYLNWDWHWSFKSLTIENCPVGVDVGSQTGSLTIFDSVFRNVSTAAVRTSFTYSSDEQRMKAERAKVAGLTSVNSLVLDNVQVIDSPNAAAVVLNGETVALSTASDGKDTSVATWVQGRVWENGQSIVQARDLAAEGRTTPRPSLLVDSVSKTHNFFEKPRPAFDSALFTRVNAVSDLGIANDGKTDVTVALQKAITDAASQNKVLFLPYGTYLINAPLYLPTNTRLLGEAWSVIMIGDANKLYADPAKPVAAIQVGKEGEVGVAQLVDLLITTQGPVPGAKLVEWNMADPEGQPGSAGMWEVHFRVGGAIGTLIDPKNCPKGDGSSVTSVLGCAGAWALMHITTKATAYLENVWGWVADHDLDYDDQINVYNARGLLVESQGPVWMYGTAFEHSLLYQYNLVNAKNVLMSQIQTETPYFQPAPLTPFPTNQVGQGTVLSSTETDPVYCTGDDRCNMALGLTIQKGSSDVLLYGAGLYSFFNLWDQACLHSGEAIWGTTPVCQLEMTQVSQDSQATMYNHNTYGSVYMLTQKESFANAHDNLNTFCSTVVADLTHRGNNRSI